MKKITIIAALAMAVFTTDTMAAPKQDKKARQEQGSDRGMRDPRKRSEMIADKLDFTAEQRARLTTLNNKYTGDNIDRKAYHEEFRAIMTDAQRQKADEWKKQRGEKGRGNRRDK
ncbi:MAG: hypothetical protein EOP56_07185 [Sphingobacteriales bacterium]|nr:MAG: hypothetical protein EOP56_07185 [Sphingobacteriales bacterium]